MKWFTIRSMEDINIVYAALVEYRPFVKYGQPYKLTGNYRVLSLKCIRSNEMIKIEGSSNLISELVNRLHV